MTTDAAPGRTDVDGLDGHRPPVPTPGRRLECERVTVRFGEVTAVDEFTAAFDDGKVHALVGQNGAGKTTLARVLAGLVEPASGEVRLDGVPVPVGSVAEARHRGVELVHQHFALPADFTVAECFELFADRRKGFAFTLSELLERAEHHLRLAGVTLDPKAVAGGLSIESLQAVEVARALASDPKVLVLDEPTAVLPPPAVDQLFDRLRVLAASGLCVIVVLHKLREVFAVADSVTVLRSGRVVQPTTPLARLTPDLLAGAIVGDTAARHPTPPPPRRVSQDPVLHTRSLAGTASGHDAPLRAVDLAVHRGEIVGVAGVEGNGQRSLVEAIVGVGHDVAGTVSIGGHDVTRSSVAGRRALGLRVIPFDRNHEGTSRSSTLWENHAVARRGGDRWILHQGRLRSDSRAALTAWNVRFQSEAQAMGELSGGNVQKCVLARELDGDVTLLIAAHPTRGLDIAASEDVRAALIDAAAADSGVLLVSADLEEMLDVCDRIVVLHGGEVAGEFVPPYDVGAIGAAMTAGAAMTTQAAMNRVDQ